MSRDGKDVAHRPSQAMCLAYGREPFAPGDSRQHDFTWDGKVYEGDSPRDAPTGNYVWTIIFWWDDGQGGERGTVMAHFTIIVGET